MLEACQHTIKDISSIVKELFVQRKLIVHGRDFPWEWSCDEVILLFATERFMKVLFTKRFVVPDGGFKHAPRRFKQVKLRLLRGHTLCDHRRCTVLGAIIV